LSHFANTHLMLEKTLNLQRKLNLKIRKLFSNSESWKKTCCQQFWKLSLDIRRRYALRELKFIVPQLKLVGLFLVSKYLRCSFVWGRGSPRYTQRGGSLTITVNYGVTGTPAYLKVHISWNLSVLHNFCIYCIAKFYF